jgi:hypothetical protein
MTRNMMRRDGFQYGESLECLMKSFALILNVSGQKILLEIVAMYLDLLGGCWGRDSERVRTKRSTFLQPQDAFSHSYIHA